MEDGQLHTLGTTELSQRFHPEKELLNKQTNLSGSI